MKRKTECPTCGSPFNVPEEFAGKRAKCSKCNQFFVVAFPAEPTEDAIWQAIDGTGKVDDTSATATLAPPTPTLVNESVQSRVIKVSGRNKWPTWIAIVGPSLGALVLGFFLGREHVKYQMRSAFADLSAALADPAKNGINRVAKAPDAKKNPPAATSNKTNPSTPKDTPTPTVAQEVSAPPPALKEPPKPIIPAVAAKPTMLSIGEMHQTNRFSITLLSASIEKAKLLDFKGDDRTGVDPDLVLRFAIVNTDDRRILRYDRGNQFLPSYFRIRDDVDNVIRRVNYGITTKIVGALTGNEDITPGMSVGHVELFAVPPPKTEFLVLTVDLKSMGGDGTIQYKIPSDQIQR